MVATDQVGRLQDFNAGGIFDHAAGVARGKAQILDDGVVRIRRIDFAISLGSETLVSAGATKLLPAKGGLAMENFHPHNSCRGTLAAKQESDGKDASDRTAHVLSPVGGDTGLSQIAARAGGRQGETLDR